MKWLHVGAAQVQSRVGDVDGNLNRMLRVVKSAVEMGVEALLFAETTAHAYDFSLENLSLAEPSDGRIAETYSGWARKYGITVLAGMIERDGGCLYNSHLVATPEGGIRTQRKHALTAVELAAGISPGPRSRTGFRINGVECAILICADGGIPGIYGELMESGVEFLFFPTAGGGVPGDYISAKDLDGPEGLAAYEADRSTVFITDAVLNSDQAMFPGSASANALGFDGRESMHRGHCTIVDTRRVLRAQIPGTNIGEHMLDQFCHARIAFDGE